MPIKANAIEKLSLDERTKFWSKVNMATGQGPDGSCWCWRASQASAWYGRFYHNGRQHLTHRIAYACQHGGVDAGAVIRHTCDNPPCCNPAHLVSGTQADNMKDMYAKGRNNNVGPRGDQHWSRTNPEKVRRGSRNVNAILTEADVANILTDYAAGGVSQKGLAAKYDVHYSLVSQILRGKAWVHVKGPRPSGPCTARGERSRGSILTEKNVLEIRKRYKRCVITMKMLADEFGVKLEAVWSVIHRRTWSHI